MLSIIGLGLDFRDISLRAMDAARKADVLLLEAYTSFLPDGYVEYLEKEAGKKAAPLKRQDLEDNVKTTVGRAKDMDVALLVPGDPLVATTHHLIINTARKLGVEVAVFHSASAFTAAIGESGLDLYKFGPTATVPFWHRNYEPTSFLDVVDRYLRNGEHTLLLLDVQQEQHRPMSISEAVGILKGAKAKRGGGLIRDGLKVIVLANAGREDRFADYLALGEAEKKLGKALSGKALSIIVPAKMSFAEEENLSSALSG